MENIKRMRTIQGAMNYLRSIDPEFAVSEWCIRHWVQNNYIEHFKSGNKTYIDLDDLINYINKPHIEKESLGVSDVL